MAMKASQQLLATFLGVGVVMALGPARGGAQSASAGKTASGEVQVIQQPSLGEIARKLRAERAREHAPAVKVYTNQNLPTSDSGLSIIGSTVPASGASGRAAAGEAGAPSAHDETYYRDRMSDLQRRLETDQRQLVVLRQQLGSNQAQYYPNPNQTLQQEYSRSTITRYQRQIDEKQQQVAADQQAISDLAEQLRREGGSPGWLREGPASPAAAANAEAPAPKPTEAEKKSRDYWQARFKAARAALAQAQEQKKLSDDELQLLKSQQAHVAANASAAAGFQASVDAKAFEVDERQGAVEKAQRALDALEKEFQESGAPADWSRTD